MNQLINPEDLPEHVAKIALEVRAALVKHDFDVVLTALLLNLDQFLQAAIEENPDAGQEMRLVSGGFRAHIQKFQRQLWRAMLKQGRPQ